MGNDPNAVFVKCPNQGCGHVLQFKAMPNYREAIIECPFCHYKSKVKNFLDFTPKTPAPMPPLNGNQQGGGDTQIVSGNQVTNQTTAQTTTQKTNQLTRVFIKCLTSGEERPLKYGENKVGRACAQPKADILFKDPEKYLSRDHATFKVVDRAGIIEIHLSDNGSANGTFVKNQRLKPRMILKVPADTIVKLGKLEFMIRIDGARKVTGGTDTVLI